MSPGVPVVLVFAGWSWLSAADAAELEVVADCASGTAFADCGVVVEPVDVAPELVGARLCSVELMEIS